MNKEWYLNRLEQLLCGLSAADRADALTYYREYFEEAGVENEQKVIEELGSVEALADAICKEIQNGQPARWMPTAPPKKNELPAWAIVLIVFGCIIFSPVIFSAVAAAVGVIVGIIGAFFGVILGFGASAIALAAFGVSLIIESIGSFFVHPFMELLLAGLGLLLIGIAILFMMAAVWLAGYALPQICKGIGWLFRRMTGKTKKEAAV